MNKICTSLEQSKKLIELGIDSKSSDMYYWSGEDLRIGGYKAQCEEFDIPAWSLTTLMNLLPSEFTEVGKYSTTTYKIKIRKYKFTDEVDLYQIAYGSIKFDVDGHHSFKDMINTGEKEDILDAAFEMVCWLKENNKI